MKRLIPILSVIVSIIDVGIAAVGLTAVAIGAHTDTVGVIAVAVPFVIVGAVVTCLSAVLTFFFRRDLLCFIAFFINTAGVLLSVISIIIWLAAL